MSLENGSGSNEVPASDNTSEWARTKINKLKLPEIMCFKKVPKVLKGVKRVPKMNVYVYMYVEYHSNMLRFLAAEMT